MVLKRQYASKSLRGFVKTQIAQRFWFSSSRGGGKNLCFSNKFLCDPDAVVQAGITHILRTIGMNLAPKHMVVGCVCVCDWDGSSGLNNAIRNPEFQSAFLDILSVLGFILMSEVSWSQDDCCSSRTHIYIQGRKRVEVDLCISRV